MKQKFIQYFLLIAIISLSFSTAIAGSKKTWKGVGVGGALIYNFQTKSWGMDIRANFKPMKKLRFVPQFTYFPSFNKIHEYYLGLGLEYSLGYIQNYNLYLLGHGGYNAWVNYDESRLKEAQYSNWVGEIGLGLSKPIKCWRPFVEFRYNFKWKESSFHLGVLYVFHGCDGSRYGNHSSYGLRGTRSLECPAYN
jgi:hypothetical protein